MQSLNFHVCFLIVSIIGEDKLGFPKSIGNGFCGSWVAVNEPGLFYDEIIHTYYESLV